MYQEVITFWFVENGHKQWFKKNKNFDKLIDHKFRGGVFIMKVSKKNQLIGHNIQYQVWHL